MKKIGYIGFSDEAVSYILSSKIFSLEIIYCEQRLLTQRLISIANKSEIPIVIVMNVNDLKNKMEKTSMHVDFYLLYKLGMILTDEMVGCYDFYNIHLGNLRSNRGAHSLNWSILSTDNETRISLYKITSGKIDEGLLISEFQIAVDPNDTTKTLRDRMELCIPDMLLQLQEYLDGRRDMCIVSGGVYRRKIKPEDYTIHLGKDTDDLIKRKVNSQAEYNGALLHIANLTFSVHGYWGNIASENEEGFFLEGENLTVYCEGREYTFACTHVCGNFTKLGEGVHVLNGGTNDDCTKNSSQSR